MARIGPGWQAGWVMEKSVNSRLSGWWAPFFGAVAAVVYFATMSAAPFPGESAAFVSVAAGVEPSTSPQNPLWFMLAGLVVALPLGTAALKLNLLSVICGGLAVGFAFRVVSNLMHRIVDAESTNDPVGRRLAWVAGAVTSLFLTFCTPFWSVSNRAHTASLDILLLLIIVQLCIRYERSLMLRDLCLALFVFGLAMAEFATVVLFLPFLLLFVLLVLWIHNEWRAGTIVAVTAAFLAGLSLYLIAAWRFVGSDLHAVQWPVPGFWEVLLHLMHIQHGLIMRSLPQTSWLLIILVTIVPWLAMLAVSRRAMNASPEPGQILLHLVMTVISGLVLFSSHFEPFYRLGLGRQLVTPFLLSAMVFGYLAAYWCFMFGQVASGPRWGSAGLGGKVERIVCGVFLTVVAVAGLANVEVADARGARIIHAYARHVVDGMGERDWLITRGEIDGNLKLAAQERGKPINVVNLGLHANDLFLRYIARKMENPELYPLADVGLVPLLSAWFNGSTSVVERVLIMADPDLWGLAQRRAVPRAGLYHGVRTLGELSGETLMGEARVFWDEVVGPLKSVGAGSSKAAPVAIVLLRELSRQANNLGVILEDLNRPADAYVAYVMADTLVTNNVSSMLNRFAMIEAGYRAADAVELKRRLKEFTENVRNDDERTMAALAGKYGWLRSPASFASMGLAWSRMGHAGLALAGVQQAIDLGGTNRSDLQGMMAGLYLAQARPDESERIYLDMLTHNPDDGSPYLELARIAAARGDVALCAERLDRAERTGVAKAQLLPERASLFLAQGKVPEAEAALSETLAIDTNSVRALTLQAVLRVRQGKLDEVKKKLIPRLLALRQLFAVQTLKAEIAMREGDVIRARQELERAHDLAPNHLPVLEMLVSLDFSEGRRDDAAVHVKRLLSIVPTHSMGNYVLGKLQIERGEYALAELSLRRSLEGRRVFATLNDLAWVLLRRGDYAEAERLVREAMERAPRVAAVHDTLGLIYKEQGRSAEAETAFEKALSLAPGSPGALLHLAELYVEQEKRNDALAIVADLEERRSELSSDQQDDLRQLARKLE